MDPVDWDPVLRIGVIVFLTGFAYLQYRKNVRRQAKIEVMKMVIVEHMLMQVKLYSKLKEEDKTELNDRLKGLLDNTESLLHYVSED